ncbi:MAG: hypothetical protein JWO12_3144 [Frankiales bacterium]|nr:hypothetical protein [Frankiales bacterium]
MAGQDHEAAAREALRALSRAVKDLYDESVDARRLALDVERVGVDLDLLCGPEKGLVEGAPPRLQVIDDTVYPQDFWMDAEDQGLGGGR